MLSSTRSLWECNGQHVAGLELRQPCGWSGGQRWGEQGKQGGEKVGGEQGLTPPGFSNKPALCSFWRTRATQNIKYLDDQTVPSQRDNVSLWLICAWMPTPWHLVNNNPFLLQTRTLFLVFLGTRQTFTVCRCMCVCVCACMCICARVCVRVWDCVGQSSVIYLFVKSG